MNNSVHWHSVEPELPPRRVLRTDLEVVTSSPDGLSFSVSPPEGTVRSEMVEPPKKPFHPPRYPYTRLIRCHDVFSLVLFCSILALWYM